MAPPRKQIKKERLKTNIQEIPEEEYIEELPELNLAPVDTTPNEFDNDYTLLLKIAVENEIPSNYIYISSDLSEIYSVYSILSSSSIEPSALLLETIYDEYMDQFQIETSDWVFIFIQQYKDVMSEEFLLDEMNKFLEGQEMPTFKNVEYMESDYFRFIKAFRLKIIEEHALVTKAVNSQKLMFGLEPMESSPIIVNSERYEYKIKLPKNSLTEFRIAELTDYIPWIVSTYDPYAPYAYRPIVGNKDSFLAKISPKMSQNAWKLFPKSINDLFQNHWYFVLWNEKEPPSRSLKETKESYTLIEIDLNKLILRLEVPISKELDQDIMTERIKLTFSNIEFLSYEKKKISGEFNIYGVELYEYSFSDMILNDNLMNIYLFIDELSTSVATKKRFTVHFKSSDVSEEMATEQGENVQLSSVNATFNQTYLVEGQQIAIEDPNKGILIKSNMKAGTPVINVTITRARDLSTVELFVKILKRLLKHYNIRKTRVENEYKNMLQIDTISYLQQRKSQRIEKPLSQQSKNQILKKQAPEIIVSNYARLCQSKYQPMIIQPSERMNYSHVLEFPKPPLSKYLFVCDNPKAPYPTIIPNLTLENKDEFPYIPCCTNKDPTQDKDSLYNAIYVENKAIEDVLVGDTKSKHTLRTNKIMGFGRNGTLPKMVSDLLSKSNDVIFRYGMVYSPSSFLHCVLFAIQDIKYSKLTTDEQREEYVQSVRKSLSVYPELLAQELYDVPNYERLNGLRNPTKFLDPALYYRALEEIYEISIYIFTGSGDELTLLNPRGKFFSARHKLDKSECVIIFQHEKEDLIDWAQCELIVSTDLAKDKNAIKIRFDSDMNDRLFDLYLNLFQTKTWSITESNELLETLNAHTMYYGLDISEEIHSHQILDSYGKLRGLVFKKPKGTMMCPPMAPLNLPEWDKPHDHLPLFGTIDQVISIVGKEPDTIVQNEAIYFLDDQNQIALRFLVNDVTSNKRVDLPYVKYILKGHDVTADLIHQRDVVGYLLQAINILFLLTSIPIQLHKIHPFIQEWIKIAGKNHKYNISGMTNPVLPLMKTEEDFFRYWVKICPDMIDLEAMKILVPSKAFKDKLVDHLQHFTSIYEGEEIVIPTVLVGTTLDMVDSSQDLLLTSRTFPIYKTIKTDPEQSIIHTKLLETYNLQTTPYYFITEDERTILVQNASTYIEALVISYEWYNEYRNSKLDLREEEKFDILLLPHILYTISPKGTLQIIENNTRDEPEYVHILRYHNEKYAALLIL